MWLILQAPFQNTLPPSPLKKNAQSLLMLAQSATTWLYQFLDSRMAIGIGDLTPGSPSISLGLGVQHWGIPDPSIIHRWIMSQLSPEIFNRWLFKAKSLKILGNLVWNCWFFWFLRYPFERGSGKGQWATWCQPLVTAGCWPKPWSKDLGKHVNLK